MRFNKWVRVLGFIGALLSMSAYAETPNPAITSLSKTQGFFYFYSSSCPHCQRFAPLLKQFSDEHGFSVVAISMDGGFLPSFPDAVMDAGQSKQFQVTVFPSLFLVDPSRQKAVLVTDGAIDSQEILRRLQKISQMREWGAS
jgi:thiol-disulfide isomerase/thioredoxin